MSMTPIRALVVLASAVATVAVTLPVSEAAALERGKRRLSRDVDVYRPIAKPMLAVVGLAEQRITVYDQTGEQMMQGPVSSGSQGYETPPGIFSVVQKNIDHHSNLYDDGSMPFMQRLTWTGIALHAGALPGYPASHGCVRLPYDFAGDLFDRTDIGMRVVIAREGIAPARIGTPAMFARDEIATARPVQLASTGPTTGEGTGRPSIPDLENQAAILADKAEEAQAEARKARAAAARARAAAQPAERGLKNARTALANAEKDLQRAIKRLEEAKGEKRIAAAEKDKAAAETRLEGTRANLARAEASAKEKLDAAATAEQAADTATAAHTQAAEAARQAKLALSPVSVLVSRATQRIYVRKAFHPMWEAPILIRDADQPIGTFVFTATEPAAGTRGLTWNVVSLYKNPTAIEPPAPRPKRAKKGEPPAAMPTTDTAAAQAALDRLDVTPAMRARIAHIVLPGSSLIISDEPPSIETGKDTDFVVVMSDEPKGALKIRKKPDTQSVDSFANDRYWRDTPRRRPPSNGFFWFQ